MGKLWSSLGSLIFFVAAPGTVAGLVPWSITRWQFRPAFAGIQPSRWLGAALIVLGLIPLVGSFARFALQGLGTPAPIAPPSKLVVTGSYRRVRNPMYVALLAILAGETLLFADMRILWWALTVWLMFHLFVVLYEEPTLKQTFGSEYETYRAHVPRWLPRIVAWSR